MSFNTHPNNKWFTLRRDFFVRKFYANFYSSFIAFRETYLLFAHKGRISYFDLERQIGQDSDKGHLWRLKDLCHKLWRENPQVDLRGCQLDWVIGSLFHEAMKLKENLYICENYSSLFPADPASQPDLPPAAASSGPNLLMAGPLTCRESRRIVENSAKEISHQMENIAFFFSQATILLRLMLVDQTANALLLRYLLENGDAVLDLWHEPLPDLFRCLFHGQSENGFYFAGLSYLEGHWYEQALQAFETAAELNPDCFDVQRQVHQLKAVLCSSHLHSIRKPGGKRV